MFVNYINSGSYIVSMNEFNLKELKLENALYIISTPIGNMQDITIRALNVLKKIDYLFCEDTRVTNILLQYYNIDKKHLYIYNDYSNQIERNKIINLLKNGNNVGLVSDAGTPLISDPGYKLVKNCINEHIKVIPICGASAILSALVSSGMPTNQFYFYGFLSKKKQEREKEIKNFKNRSETIILYETPTRIVFTLNEIYNMYGNIDICIARELTKLFEEIKTDKLLNFLENYNNKESIKGEFVLIFNIFESLNQKQFTFDVDKINYIYDFLKKDFKKKDIIDFIVNIGISLDKKELYDFFIKK